jgi:hypothetical protein
MSQEPFEQWRIRITGEHTHQWEVCEDSTWKTFDAASTIRLATTSTLGYVFLDQQWQAHAGLGPEDPRLKIKAQPSASPDANPFGPGETPSFPASNPGSTQSPDGVEHRWDLVGTHAPQYTAGFPHTTEGQVWKFSIFYGAHQIDPEIIVEDPNDPPDGI